MCMFFASALVCYILCQIIVGGSGYKVKCTTTENKRQKLLENIYNK